MASVIQCKKDDEVVFEGRALDDGSDFYKTLLGNEVVEQYRIEDYR